MSQKEEYRELCATENMIPVFSRDWWLDAVCGPDNWDVMLMAKGNKIVASFPYYIKRKWGVTALTMPLLTPFLGIWIKYPEQQKYTARLSFEEEILENFISRIPKTAVFRQTFHHSFQNCLPFYWSNFKQQIRYTYVIDKLDELDNVFANFRDTARQQIRKAEKIVQVHLSDDIEGFYELNKKTFSRQGLKPPYSLNFIKTLDAACRARDCRAIFFAEDAMGTRHAAIYIVWDETSSYYLMGGIDPALRNSGAQSLLIWEAIKYCSTKTKMFDFEGSMLRAIEKFFRTFGGRQKPYFYLSRSSVIWEIAEIIMSNYCIRQKSEGKERDK